MKKWKRRQFTYICSFCGKDQDQVRRLIAGPGGVYVCDECIDGVGKEGSEQARASSTLGNSESASRENQCSFCGRRADQVQYLYEGPKGVRICSECIDLCHEIIDEEQRRLGH